MAKKELAIGKFFGILITIDFSWIFIFLIVFASFALSILPALVPGYSWLSYIFYGLIGTIMFFLSVLLHEMSHTLVARRMNIGVDKITLFLFGGVSNLQDEPDTPGKEFKMAIAGPLMSLLIAVFLFFVVKFVGAYFGPIFNVLFRSLAGINIALGLFNLLPGFPLDGGRVLRSLVWYITKNFKRATRIATIAGKVIAILIILFGVFEFLISSFFSGIWLILIGFFLYGMAEVSYKQEILIPYLKNITVKMAVPQRRKTFSKGTEIFGIYKEYVCSGQSHYMITDQDRIVGIVNIRDLVNMELENERLDDYILPVLNLDSVRYDDSLMLALSKINRSSDDLVLVRDNDGKIVDFLDSFDVSVVISKNQELQKELGD